MDSQIRKRQHVKSTQLYNCLKVTSVELFAINVHNYTIREKYKLLYHQLESMYLDLLDKHNYWRAADIKIAMTLLNRNKFIEFGNFCNMVNIAI